MDYSKLCEDILKLDPKIRFAGVFDDTGEIKYGGQPKVLRTCLCQKNEKIKHSSICGDCVNLAQRVGKGL